MKKQYKSEFKIRKFKISNVSDVYFIADIAANHDGSLFRAKKLIKLAKESGAHCAKFQHFLPERIISDTGFTGKKLKVSHQEKWDDSVFNIYKKYHTPRKWTEELISCCIKNDIDFMTTPYDYEAVETLNKYLKAFKIGSGDLTFKDLIVKIAKKKKPIFLACGASNETEVFESVEEILKYNDKICLMQCNTNYTANTNNMKYQNLNVLKRFASIWPNMPLGLSDHTFGHEAVLGAIALGARAIEKHFTDDNDRNGPDHKFAMNPKTWTSMVESSKKLLDALGSDKKEICKNEAETVIIQRRAIRTKFDLDKNEKISYDNIKFLRPCPKNALGPNKVDKIIGKKLNKKKRQGEELYLKDLI